MFGVLLGEKKKIFLLLGTKPEKHMVSLAELLHTWQNKSQQQETKIYPATFHVHKLRTFDAGLLALPVVQ